MAWWWPLWKYYQKDNNWNVIISALGSARKKKFQKSFSWIKQCWPQLSFLFYIETNMNQIPQVLQFICFCPCLWQHSLWFTQWHCRKICLIVTWATDTTENTRYLISEEEHSHETFDDADSEYVIWDQYSIKKWGNYGFLVTIQPPCTCIILSNCFRFSTTMILVLLS